MTGAPRRRCVVCLRILLLLSAYALAPGCTCSPGAIAAESPAFAYFRDDFVQGCCNCLSRESVVVKDPDAACPEALADAAVDGGEPRGPIETSCLCGDDAASCREKLNAGDAISVVGLCVDRDTACQAACDGVLAYPIAE